MQNCTNKKSDLSILIKKEPARNVDLKNSHHNNKIFINLYSDGC